MCLLAIAWQVHPDYPLVVCANRDEFYARPAQVAHFWPDHPQLFGGRDLQQGGSWMGISRKGRFSAITNIRDPQANRADASSRGLLVSRFLQGEGTALDYCETLQSQGQIYNGYNLIAYDGCSLVYQSNYTAQPQCLAPGLYGVSNSTLDIAWPKAQSAVQKLGRWLEQPGTIDQLALLLNDRSIVADQRLPQTGVPLALERVLSAEFIEHEEYGTRCSTALLVHRSGLAEYCEVTHHPAPSLTQQRIEDFLPAF
ncbi:MAG: NRDE family protein [Gammaproteobacteria bacterium]|nr:NRDE family protein [Gammaproteobacteria bacterium]MBL6999790.1 NRDE family protein [Gammaproteobacteria bacterium]